MPGRIFVNYRRDDSAANALSIAQYLERTFGARNVFLDIDRMRAGQNFPAVLEEKLFAVLMAATPDDDLVEVRAQADRDLMPYRRNMTAAQVEQLHKQYVRKRLLERSGVPRLSLFYMH